MLPIAEHQLGGADRAAGLGGGCEEPLRHLRAALGQRDADAVPAPANIHFRTAESSAIRVS
jgi:hypothetical protein